MPFSFELSLKGRTMSFADLGLDLRVLRALAKGGYDKPTPVQAACIEKTHEGKDVVARACTGSGKTLAYILPALHRLLALPPEQQVFPWQTLILVPTKELCEQVKKVAADLIAASGAKLAVTALIAKGLAQRDQFLHPGQIVVSTPGRVASALKEGKLRPQLLQPDEKRSRPGLSFFVIDEADLILSMPGYADDLRALVPQVPRGCQCMLMSATTNEAVEDLQKLMLHSPVILDLVQQPLGEGGGAPEPGTSAAGLAAEIDHYGIRCSRQDKLLYVMALLKLGLVARKVLLFVNKIEDGFRLRLFLESFGIRSAVISPELPMNSRHHILQEFNRGVFDYLIAADVQSKTGYKQKSAAHKAAKKDTKRKRAQPDEEFGVTRGVDFKGVATVLNVDLPGCTSSYVHRAGRTGRAGSSGTAISLVAPEDVAFEACLVQELAQAALDSNRAAEQSEDAAISGPPSLRPYPKLEKAVVEALRYRAEDTAGAITAKVVREARAKELRLELINSQRLETHFQEHPGDLALLKHDKSLVRTPEAPHLKHLPPYLRAAGMPARVGPGGMLPPLKRRKLQRAVDPIKGGFLKAPKKGTHSEPLTDIELKAEKYGAKLAKKERKNGTSYVPKRNVRKKR